MRRLLLVSLFMPIFVQAQDKPFLKTPWEMLIASSGSGIFVNVCIDYDPSITITGFGFIGNVSCSSIPGKEVPGAVDEFSFELDPSTFSPTAQFKLSMNIEVFPGHQSCIRLFDVTGNAPVPGTDVCQATPETEPTGHFYRAESAPVSLPREARIYTVQGSDEQQGQNTNFLGSPGTLFKVRLIATR